MTSGLIRRDLALSSRSCSSVWTDKSVSRISFKQTVFGLIISQRQNTQAVLLSLDEYMLTLIARNSSHSSDPGARNLFSWWTTVTDALYQKEHMDWKEKKSAIDLFRAFSSCCRETRRVCGQICSWRIIGERDFGFRGACHSKMNRQSRCRLEDHRSERNFSAEFL